jgi:hypothetical protein
MLAHFDWEVPPLDGPDQRLVDAYLSVGRNLDELPYTEDFERLRELVGLEATDVARNFIFRRLLRFRNMGRLPRISMSV